MRQSDSTDQNQGIDRQQVKNKIIHTVALAQTNIEKVTFHSKDLETLWILDFLIKEHKRKEGKGVLVSSVMVLTVGGNIGHCF